MEKFLWLIFATSVFKSQVIFAFSNAPNSSKIPSAICKIIMQIIVENPETQTIFFGISDVALSTDVIEESLKCLPKNIPMITTEIMKKDSKLLGSWTDDTNVTLDKSTIVVIFADDVDKVGIIYYFE
mgnify:FL=1